MYRCQRLLQGASFQILVTAVSKSPSVLGSIEADKAESVANLSGVSWTNCNPKVLFYFLENVHLNIVVHISVRKDGGFFYHFCHARAPDFKHLRVKIDFKCFYSQKCVFTIQEVEVGLQSKAWNFLWEAYRKAEEEFQSYSQDYVESGSIIETYMTLANFCDKILREHEQRHTGVYKNELAF